MLQTCYSVHGEDAFAVARTLYRSTAQVSLLGGERGLPGEVLCCAELRCAGLLGEGGCQLRRQASYTAGLRQWLCALCHSRVGEGEERRSRGREGWLLSLPFSYRTAVYGPCPASTITFGSNRLPVSIPLSPPAPAHFVPPGITFGGNLLPVLLRELLVDPGENSVELYEGAGGSWKRVK